MNRDQVTFLTDPLEADIQIAGPLSAHFWESTSEEDVDLIVALRDFDEEGNETRFAYYQAGQPDEPVTRGWLRASLRALDPERSLPLQPFYSFDVQLKSGEGVWQTVYEGARFTAVTLSGLDTGSYAVRSRPRRLDGSQVASGWSPTTSFHIE